MLRRRWFAQWTIGLVVAAVAVSPGLGGMAELGRDATDPAGGGKKSTLKVNPVTDEVDPTINGQTAAQVVQAWATEIENDPEFRLFQVDEVNGNHITLSRRNRGRDVELEIDNTEGGFERGRVMRSASGASTNAADGPGPEAAQIALPEIHSMALIYRTNAPAGDGVVTVVCNQSGAAVVPTSGLNADTLLDQLAAALQAQGFDAQREGDVVRIEKCFDLEWDDTDSGLTDWRIAVKDDMDIPTLSQVGLAVLLTLLALSGLVVLRRRHPVAADRTR